MFNKCNLFQKSCTYLGYHIDGTGISLDKNKISKITFRTTTTMHIDIACPVNHLHYMVIIDAYSKWPQIFHVKSITSTSILDCMWDFTSRRRPCIGTQFTSKSFSDFCKSRGICHKYTELHHPQSNVQVKRIVNKEEKFTNIFKNLSSHAKP